MTRTRRCGPLLIGQGRSRTCDFQREPQARRRADASPAAASGAGHGLRDLLPVRSMTRTRRCGPLLKKGQGRSGTCDFQREPQARRRADASPAAASGAGHGLLDLLPVRSMIRARRCGPLLKRAGKGAAAFAISRETRKHGGLMQVFIRRPRPARFIAGAIDDTHTALRPVAQERARAQRHLRFPERAASTAAG